METEQNNESTINPTEQPKPEEAPHQKPDISVEATQHIENLREAYDQHNVNKVDVYFSAGGRESDKIDFSILPVSTGRESTLPFGQQASKRFGESRMLLISHSPSHDEEAADAIAQIVRQHCPGRPDAVCCTLQLQSAFPVSRLISEFRASPLCRPGEAQALVVFENREHNEAASFLSAFTRKGGSASSLSLELARQNIWLIYAGQQAGLPETAVQQDLHAAYHLVNSLILGISRETNDYDEAMAIYQEVTATSRLTGWLRSGTESDIVREITSLLKAGSLQTALENQRSKISYPEEREAVRKLLAEPIKSMILFIATYFDDISVIDFDRLVKLLINELPETLITQQKNGAFDLLWEWETNADLLLADCGLQFDLSEKKKIPAYRFEKSIRRDALLEYFSSSQRLVLLRRHEIISRGLFSAASVYSQGIISGCLALNFENAAINPHHYLAGFCLNMADWIADDDTDDTNGRRKQNDFLWLVGFIRTWEDHEVLKSYLGLFYKQMMETESRREILGALLTHICIPERPANLARLKTFLENTGSREMSGCFRMIRVIVLNYLDQLHLFFSEVDTWTDTAGGEPAKSCAFIKIACTFIFYNGWLEKRGKRSLALQLLEKVSHPDSAASLSLLSQFIFGPSAAVAFRRIYSKLYQENYLQEKLLKTDTEDDLQLIWAIVLTQWHDLLQNPGNSAKLEPADLEKLLAPALQQALNSHRPGRMEVALNKAVTIINKNIERIKNLPPAIQTSIAPLEAKRSSARILIRLLRTYSTDHGTDR